MKEGELLEIQTGVSYTSVKNARLNLNTEANGATFDEVKFNANLIWNQML